MKIGVIKEIKILEGRVALTPNGIHKILESNPGKHEIYVQSNAGIKAGFPDNEYVKAGAKILPTAKEVYDEVTMLVHVKEPLPPEFPLIRSEHIIFTYLHLAPEPELTQKLMDVGCVGFAYETLEIDGGLPLLAPMSKVAGKMAFVYALYCSQKSAGGIGVYLGEIDGKSQSRCLIVGGGVVGVNSADSMLGIGANVTIIERDPNRRAELEKKYPDATILADTELKNQLPLADIIIGAVLVAGAKAPKLISRDDLKLMKKGAVFVDISIDQGGICTESRATSIKDPTYVVDDIVLCCIPNIPGTVPRTSTELLTEATLPYVIQLANEGLDVIKTSREFQTALNVYKGKCTNKPVADALGFEYTDPTSL